MKKYYYECCNILCITIVLYLQDLKLEILSTDERIEAEDFNSQFYQNLEINTRKDTTEISEQNKFLFKKLGKDSLLLDVRSKEQFDMCRIEGSSNVSIDKLEQRSEDLLNYSQENGINRGKLFTILFYIISRRIYGRKHLLIFLSRRESE